MKKYFVTNYQHPVSAAAVALEEFGQVSSGAPELTFENGPLRVRVGFTSRTAFAGQLVRFFAQFSLQHGWHIYGVPLLEGYTATSIEFEDPAIIRQDLTYPEPEMVQLPLLNQLVPMYSGSVGIQGTLLLKFHCRKAN
jgi:hypothetical protein